MEMQDTAKSVWRVIFLLILIGIFMGVLTWTGVVKCSVIPGWCDVYFGVFRYATGGQPRVAIVFGDDGMGDPEALGQFLSDPRILGVHPIMMHLENLELGNIKDFDLVIVERAKTIKTEKLDIFVNYVLRHGGRLVWTGDAGTGLGKDDKLLYFEQRDGKAICEDIIDAENIQPEDINRNQINCFFRREAEAIGPWARVRDDKTILNFDQLLGLNYHGNYCEITTKLPARTGQTRDEHIAAAAKCFVEKRLVGKLIPEATKSHPLILGLRTDLGYYGDFAVVDEISGGISTRVLSLQFDGKLVIQNDSNRIDDLGNILPIIQTTGIGERVAYYAAPPEQFAMQPMNYISIPENMYIGMVRG
jgi:hypothetical protein